MKLLVIEDEPEMRRSIRTYLQDAGSTIDSANDYPSAKEKAEAYTYDCILVDITLPKGNGLDIVRMLRQRDKDCGIIIISAKNSLDDKIAGLDLGADDYLPKPFHLSELNARIRALVRRKQFQSKRMIEIGELRIIPEDRVVTVNATDVPLTRTEFDLLVYLVVNRDRVLSRNAITEHVWGDLADRMENQDFLYWHMKNLRKKLMEQGCPDLIKTVYGIGYRLTSKA